MALHAKKIANPWASLWRVQAEGRQGVGACGFGLLTPMTSVMTALKSKKFRVVKAARIQTANNKSEIKKLGKK